MTEQQYEYKLEKRSIYLKRGKWSRETGYYLEDIEDAEWTDWHDASGYNKQGSVYRKLSHVKCVITNWNRLTQTRQGSVKHEFRLLRRPVQPPPPWELSDELG